MENLLIVIGFFDAHDDRTDRNVCATSFAL
jgi:hypothetical protein